MRYLFKSSKIKRVALLSTVLCTVFMMSNSDHVLADDFVVEASAQASKKQSVKGDYKGLLYAPAVRSYYDERGGKFFWVGLTGVRDHAHELIYLLSDSWTHGLNPSNYHLSAIQEQLAKGVLMNRSKLEKLFSDAYIAYARDMGGMRVEAKKLGLEAKNWRQASSVSEIASNMEGGDKSALVYLDGLVPKSHTYQALRAELARLIKEPDPPYAHLLPLNLDGNILRPGDGHASVPLFRERLGLENFSSSKFYYDDHMASAVMSFQRENGLNSDGVIGGATIKLMNRSVTHKIEQVLANLERLRWVKDERPDRFLVVNIPSAKLWAIENGKVDSEMKAIVGRPGRETQPFVTNVTGVRFNPTWTVPSTIKRYDMIPKLREDPYYLTKIGIEIMKGYGADQQSIDPTAIDWVNSSYGELASYRMVQPPGENNPLGRVRILMPNKYNIFLHDTNKPEKFDYMTRALSSGCVRMQYPERIADFVMRTNKGWSESKISEYFETGEKTDVYVSEKIPVYLLYYTAWLDSKGSVVYGNDLYGRDKELVSLLKNIDGISVLRHNEAEVVFSE